MAYGIQISSALGSDDITDLSSYRIFAVDIESETVTTSAQSFNYTAPSGWTSSNGTFYVLPNSVGVLPAFEVTAPTTLTASFTSFNSTYKADSWRIFWLVKTGTDVPTGYGMYISNASNQTIISADTETLLSYGTGTLTSYTTSNTGFRSFSLPLGFDETTDAIFVKVVDGADYFAISRPFYADASDYKVCSTTETALEYFSLRRSFSLVEGSGYGMSVFSDTGSLVYSTEYDIFPSNGTTLRVAPSQSQTIVSGTDLWVNLNFGTPAPFCPDGGSGAFPTFNYIRGVERVGLTISEKMVSIRDDDPSGEVGFAHNNTALLVQR